MKVMIDMKDPKKAAIEQVLKTLVSDRVDIIDSPADATLVISEDVRKGLAHLKAGKHLALILDSKDMPTAFGLATAPLYAGKVQAFQLSNAVAPLAKWVAALSRKEEGK